MASFFQARRPLADIISPPLEERIGERCTIAREAAAEVPIHTLRPGWWRDIRGGRRWVRAVREWSGSGSGR